MFIFVSATATFKLTSHLPLPSKPPKYCTKFFAEFSGKQQKLSAFFSQNSAEYRPNPAASNPEKRKLTENGTDQVNGCCI